MEKLEIKPGKAYITENSETAFIVCWNSSNGNILMGFVSGRNADFCEWLDNAVNTVDKSLNLIEEVKIEIKNPEKFESWKKKLMLLINDEHKEGLLWACMLQWARLMEQEIKTGQKIKEIAHKLAEDAGIVEHTDGEFAITILYQCWKHGEDLMSIKDYRPYCTL